MASLKSDFAVLGPVPCGFVIQILHSLGALPFGGGGGTSITGAFSIIFGNTWCGLGISPFSNRLVISGFTGLFISSQPYKKLSTFDSFLISL